MSIIEVKNSEREERMEIKGVIFDVDGLLVDTEKIHVDAWESVFSKKGIFLTRSDYDEGIGIADREFLIELKRKGKIPKNLDIDSICDEKEKYFLEIIKNGINTFEGVFETIKFLKEKRLKIAAASNSKKVFVKSVLEYSNLIKFFDFFVAREDVENPKPAPDIYEKVVKLMGLKKENVVVFEDSEVGIESAKKAGLFCIAVASTQGYDKLKKADVIIEKIEKRKIEEILRGGRSENI